MIRNKDRLKSFFFTHPTAKLRVREIERQAGLPLPSVTRYAKELVKESILQRVDIGKTTFYTCDRTSEEYLMQKQLFNLSELHESGLINKLRETFHNPPMRLFGSYSLGEDVEESDIDIYIQTPQEEIPRLEEYERILRRNIQLFLESDIKDMRNKDLANNIMNGIPLNGFIEVFE